MMVSTMLLDPRLAKPAGAAEPIGFNSRLKHNRLSGGLLLQKNPSEKQKRSIFSVAVN
jgi:hypothetical protein